MLTDLHLDGSSNSHQYQKEVILRHTRVFQNRINCYPRSETQLDRLKDRNHDCFCGNSMAYIHIWKSGGTQVYSHCGCHGYHKHLETLASNRSLFTFVRDPVAHFISGFVECQFRLNQINARPTVQSVIDWLSSRDDCNRHSWPQIWSIPKEIQAIVHISDMHKFFVQNDLPWNARVGDFAKSLRHYHGWAKYTEEVKHLVHNEAVLVSICNYVAVDYCMLDFDPPALCRSVVQKRCEDFCKPD